MGRNADPAVILAAILDSHFIMSLKDHSLLREKIRLIFEMAVWPTAEEVGPQFANYLTTLEAAEGAGNESHRQLKAHHALEEGKHNLAKAMKEAEKWHRVIEASQAMIDQSEDVIGMYTKASGKGNKPTPGRGGGLSAGKGPKKICFKCGEEGTHMFKDCPSTRTPVCSECKGQHHSNAHKIVQELKAKRAGRAAPWTNVARNDIEGHYCSHEDLMEAYEGMIQDQLDDEEDIEAMNVAMNSVYDT